MSHIVGLLGKFHAPGVVLSHCILRGVGGCGQEFLTVSTATVMGEFAFLGDHKALHKLQALILRPGIDLWRNGSNNPDAFCTVLLWPWLSH